MVRAPFPERFTLFEKGCRIGDEPYGVIDAFLLAPLVHRRHREASVGSDLDLHLGPGLPQSTHDPLEDRKRAAAGVGVATSQECRDELVCLSVEDEQRMVHTRAVVAVVEGALLLAVGGIVGGIEIQKYPLRSATPTAFSDVKLPESSGDAQTVLRTWSVLQT